MPLLEVVVPGDPVPKGRPRTAVVQGRTVTYTPERTRDAEAVVGALIRRSWKDRDPVLRPVGLAVEFYCATKRRTDGDNLLKLVTDAMNGLVYCDDSQIEEWFCRVHRGVGSASARTEVLVYDLDAVEEMA